MTRILHLQTRRVRAPLRVVFTPWFSRSRLVPRPDPQSVAGRYVNREQSARHELTETGNKQMLVPQLRGPQQKVAVCGQHRTSGGSGEDIQAPACFIHSNQLVYGIRPLTPTVSVWFTRQRWEGTRRIHAPRSSTVSVCIQSLSDWDASDVLFAARQNCGGGTGNVRRTCRGSPDV